MSLMQASVRTPVAAWRKTQRAPEMHPVREAVATAVDQPQAEQRRLPVAQLLFSLLVLGVIFTGWQLRDAEYIVAEEGYGYALGIVGGVMMLSLLLYPVRKKARFMRNWGAVCHWFRMHMLFGVLGPTAILLHCNFHLGATNSNVALFSMLVVAGSGLVGRYVYTKIHFGLYGRRATLDELQARSGLIGGEVQGALAQTPGVVQELQRFHRIALRPSRGLLAGLRMLVMLGFAARATRRHALHALACWMKQQAVAEGWEPRIHEQRLDAQRALIASYIASLRQVAEFTMYERLFALWHVLHIPLFFMLVLAGVVHVFAVHIY